MPTCVYPVEDRTCLFPARYGDRCQLRAHHMPLPAPGSFQPPALARRTQDAAVWEYPRLTPQRRARGVFGAVGTTQDVTLVGDGWHLTATRVEVEARRWNRWPTSYELLSPAYETPTSYRCDLAPHWHAPEHTRLHVLWQCGCALAENQEWDRPTTYGDGLLVPAEGLARVRREFYRAAVLTWPEWGAGEVAVALDLLDEYLADPAGHEALSMIDVFARDVRRRFQAEHPAVVADAPAPARDYRGLLDNALGDL